MMRKFISKQGPGLALTAASIVLVAAIQWMGFFDRIGYMVLDFSFHRIRGPISGWAAREEIPKDDEPFSDVGIDGLPDPQETGYDQQLNPDPAGDNFDPNMNPHGSEGNGRYDQGEPFTDRRNNRWDDGEEFSDVGPDGRPDVHEVTVYDPGSNPDPAGDNFDPVENPAGTEGNGRQDEGEPVMPGLNSGSSDGEAFLDLGADGLPDSVEVTGYDPETNADPAGDNYDPTSNRKGREGNGRYDDGEPFNDTIGNQKWDKGLNVVLVEVDDETWRLVPQPWPYPRDEVWAKAVRNLAGAGARMIVFDMEFDSPDRKSAYLESIQTDDNQFDFVNGDDELADAIRYAQSLGTDVVLAAKLVTEQTRRPPQYIQRPLDRLLAAGPETGLANEPKDKDGVTRKYSIFYTMMHEPDNWYMTLGLKSLKRYVSLADSLRPVPYFEFGRDEIGYGPFAIQTYGRASSFLVNFYGPPSGKSLPGKEAWKTFNRYPLSNVLDDAEFDLKNMDEDTDWMDLFIPSSEFNQMMFMIDPNHQVPVSPFQDKIVLIGVSVNVLLDVKTTPFYNFAGMPQMMPGVEYHANALQTILDGNFIRVLGGTLEMDANSGPTHVLLVAGLALLTFVLLLRLSPVSGGLVVVGLIAVFIDIALGYFTSDLLWLPKFAGLKLLPSSWIAAAPELFTIGSPAVGASVVVPVIPGMASMVVTYGSIVLYRFIVERQDKQFLKNTFGTYISPELIDEMYETKQMPALGGDSGIRTAYFTDIASFSAFSEVLTATRLVELLNEYLTSMTDVLLEYQGTLDKYEGDAIVAFFGAPIFFEDHAYRACLVSLQMQEALGVLREKWSSEGDKWPDLVSGMRMRIGINSGDIVTGNMGSRTRMNYTMMGDVVNTAARLEASAKQYGIYIQTTMPTLELAGPDKFEWRNIDKVRVMGKKEPVNAVEIMALKGKLQDELMEMRGFYNSGLELYRAQKWDEASAKFTQSEALEEVFPKRPNTPSRVYLERCEHFKANPPGDDWDGVWTLTAK